MPFKESGRHWLQAPHGTNAEIPPRGALLNFILSSDGYRAVIATEGPQQAGSRVVPRKSAFRPDIGMKGFCFAKKGVYEWI